MTDFEATAKARQADTRSNMRDTSEGAASSASAMKGEEVQHRSKEKLLPSDYDFDIYIYIY